MRNAKLGRAVLNHVVVCPEEFDMGTYGYLSGCGTIACLAGHAMLRAGYSLMSGGYYRPDGSYVECEPDEAALLLGLTDDECHPPREMSLFASGQSNAEGIARFRELVEKAEADL